MLLSAQAADFLPLNSQPSSLNAAFRISSAILVLPNKQRLACIAFLASLHDMSIEAIQQEIETWNPEQRHKLMLHLALLRRRDDPERAAKLARLIDDKTPGNWVTGEEAFRRLDALPGE